MVYWWGRSGVVVLFFRLLPDDWGATMSLGALRKLESWPSPGELAASLLFISLMQISMRISATGKLQVPLKHLRG